MIYAYIRVSSIGQNVSRQLEDILNFGVNKKNIFVDKQSGKDFNWKNYQKLKKKLKENDLLIIKSIDRLGRNYEMIIEEWRLITKTIKANIFVIDMPLLDTRDHPNNLMGKVISDIVLQLLSFVAEKEREFIKQRQAEGIAIAKKNGVKFGRPKYILPDNFSMVAKLYIKKEISLLKALEMVHMSQSTFIKYLKKETNEIH